MSHASRLTILITAVLLSGCGGNSGPGQPTPADTPTRFVVIGDFGTGGPQQHLVAGALDSVCQQRGCDFIASTGDNIYDGGVISEYDPQFESKFELPYMAIDAPWYLSLGNHDLDAPAVEGDAGDFQVAYSYRTDRLSEKWNMPARWYSIDFDQVDIVILDTNLISADGVTGNDDSSWASEQQPTIDAALNASDADWIFAFGHHPYRSNGGHANPPEQYQARIRETLCGRVDAFFAGHDHVLSWLEQAPDCPRAELLVSGAGGQTPDLTETPNNNPHHYHAINTYGFIYVEVRADSWTGTFYDENAEPLFERTVSR